MAKEKIPALDYMRGLSMLGVIGIHSGSYYLSNPIVNIHLFAFFDIVTRFCVPIFFFISAFGLFYNLKINEPFDYKSFMVKRFKTVLLPYLTWSIIYLIYYVFRFNDSSILNFDTILRYLIFGLCSYQLYFLVLLLWFYLLMPLWIKLVKAMTIPKLSILFIFQIFFDYYSEYLSKLHFNVEFFNNLITYRLNYLVLYYIFIFILGAYCAIHYKQFSQFLKTHTNKIILFGFSTLIAMLSYYYYLVLVNHYTLEQAGNTAHQLSSPGVFYTLGATLALFAIFNNYNLSSNSKRICSFLGKHSYFAYLVHPLVMYFIYDFMAYTNRLMTFINAILFFIFTILFSLLIAKLFTKIYPKIPILGLLLNGTNIKKVKSS